MICNDFKTPKFCRTKSRFVFIYGSLIVSMETWAKHFIFYINRGRFVSILHQFQCALSKTNTKIKDFSKTDLMMKRQQFQSYHMEAVPVSLKQQWKTLQNGQHSAEHLWIRDEIEKTQLCNLTGKEFIVRRNHQNYKVIGILAMRHDQKNPLQNECCCYYTQLVHNLEICVTQNTSKV